MIITNESLNFLDKKENLHTITKQFRSHARSTVTNIKINEKTVANTQIQPHKTQIFNYITSCYIREQQF